MRAYRAYERLRANSNHRAWLYKIATNCTNTALRRGNRRGGHDVEFEDELHEMAFEPAESAQQQVLFLEAVEEMQAAIVCLPGKQRSALILRHVQGFEYGEIAEALGCSEDSARANVYQALRRLRREFGEK